MITAVVDLSDSQKKARAEKLFPIRPINGPYHASYDHELKGLVFTSKEAMAAGLEYLLTRYDLQLEGEIPSDLRGKSIPAVGTLDSSKAAQFDFDSSAPDTTRLRVTVNGIDHSDFAYALLSKDAGYREHVRQGAAAGIVKLYITPRLTIPDTEGFATVLTATGDFLPLDELMRFILVVGKQKPHTHAHPIPVHDGEGLHCRLKINVDLVDRFHGDQPKKGLAVRLEDARRIVCVAPTQQHAVLFKLVLTPQAFEGSSIDFIHPNTELHRQLDRFRDRIGRSFEIESAKV